MDDEGESEDFSGEDLDAYADEFEAVATTDWDIDDELADQADAEAEIEDLTELSSEPEGEAEADASDEAEAEPEDESEPA